MYNVVTDRNQNRITITLSGAVTREEAKAVVAKLEEEVRKVKIGFDVITDISNCKLGYLNASPILRQAMNMLQKKGVRKVVRVVGRMKIILAQFKKISDGFSGYRPHYVVSMKDAEEILARE